MEVISTRMTANVVAPASQVLANASRMMGHKALGLLVRCPRVSISKSATVILRACDFISFLAISQHLSHLFSLLLFGQIQKSHTL